MAPSHPRHAPPSSQTCVIRAWDRSKPLLFCPAMNTAMWEHPITEQQVGQLKDFGYIEIPCVAKKLVCGDQGGCLARLTAHSCSLISQPVVTSSSALSPGKWKW